MSLLEAEAKAHLEFRDSNLAHDPENGATNNDRLSPQMRVAPLGKGQVAVYRLIAADQDDSTRTTLDGKPMKKTQGYLLTGIKKIFDPYARREVIITSGKVQARRTPTAFGVDAVSKRPKQVVFSSHSPVVIVKEDEPEMYSFMERCDENKSNPYRNPRKKAWFYRVDPRRKIQNQLEMADQ